MKNFLYLTGRVNDTHRKLRELKNVQRLDKNKYVWNGVTIVVREFIRQEHFRDLDGVYMDRTFLHSMSSWKREEVQDWIWQRGFENVESEDKQLTKMMKKP